MEPAGLIRFWDSSVGKKIVMGATGLDPRRVRRAPHGRQPAVLRGSERFDAYSHLLQVDIDRAHVAAARRRCSWRSCCTSSRRTSSRCATARRARPTTRSASRRSRRTPSRTMRWGGVYLLLFIPYHLMHFTTGTLHPAFVRGPGVRQRRDRLPVDLGGGLLPRRDGVPRRCISTTAPGRPSARWASRARRTIRCTGASRSRIAIVVPVGFSLLPLSVMLGFIR